MKYNPKIVIAYFESQGIPKPEVEYKFHPERKWRFDFAWPDNIVLRGTMIKMPVALEVDGGIWIAGGHNRGAQMLKTWEKENEAVCMRWGILRCQPKDLCTEKTASLIKRALNL